MEKLIGSLRVDVSQYEQRAAAVTHELAAETDKVRSDNAHCIIIFNWIWIIFIVILA